MKTLIEVQDGLNVARQLDHTDIERMQRALSFRYRVFLEELGWSSHDDNGHDRDCYDDSSVHFAAFDENGTVTGYCRAALPQSSFMIEREFADLVHPYHRIQKDPDTTEVSRFAIARRLRGKTEGFSTIALLVTTVYRWATANNLRYIYLALFTDHLSFLQAYFPWVESIGPTFQYQPGVRSSAVLVDLKSVDIEKTQEFWAMLTGKPR